MTKANIVVIEGDGIGSEVTREAKVYHFYFIHFFK